MTLTAQEIFDKTWQYLKEQDFHRSRKSIKGKSLVPSCAYRGTDGRKCAFGFWIDDADYLEEMEGKTAEMVIKEYDLTEYEPFIALFNKLQEFHDATMATDNLLPKEDLLHVNLRRYNYIAPTFLLNPISE